MAKKGKRHFRRTKRSHGRRKMTPVRIGKWLIGGLPHVFDGWDAFQTGGPKAVADDLGKKFTGFDRNTGSFNWMDLLRGYLPAAGAWGFGKVYSRVFK